MLSTHHSPAQQLATALLLLAPFALSSDELPPACLTRANSRGSYTALLKPCTIEYYRSSSTGIKNTRNAYCSTEIRAGELLGFDEQYLALWPDECVGEVARCYSKNNVSNYTFPAQTKPPPDETTHIMIDCVADREATENAIDASGDFIDQVGSKVGETLEGVGESLNVRSGELLDNFILLGRLLYYSLLVSIFGGVYCCLRPCLVDNNAFLQRSPTTRYNETAAYNRWRPTHYYEIAAHSDHGTPSHLVPLPIETRPATLPTDAGTNMELFDAVSCRNVV